MLKDIIDVYDQNDIDVAAADKLGIVAILHETAQGLWHDDSRYRHKKTQAVAPGILWGGYYLLSGEDVDQQLEHCLSLEDGSDGKTLTCVDWESTSRGAMSLKSLHSFVEAYSKKVGFYPMLYGGKLIRETKELIDGDELLANCPLWYARFNDAPIGIPTATWPEFTLWQFDDEKRQYGAPPKNVLPGADFNNYSGSLAELRNDWPFR